MFCPNCGKEVQGKFCVNCGTEIPDISNGATSPTNGKRPNVNVNNTPNAKKRGIGLKGILSGIGSVAVIVLLIAALTGKFDKAAHEMSGGAYGGGETTKTTAQTKNSGNGKLSDLYDVRLLSEDELVEAYGLEKNEFSSYPSMNEATIVYADGAIYITITGEKAKKYSFLGVKPGDSISNAETVIEGKFTYLGDMEDYYSDFA